VLIFYWGFAVGAITGLLVIFVPRFKELRYLIATLTLETLIPLTLTILFNWQIELGIGHLSLSVSELTSLFAWMRFGIVFCLATLFACFGFGLGFASALLLGSLFERNGRKAV
jgi:hypothetical protein